MFAYVDETGNTGSRLLDDQQPVFVTGALLTRSDFDRRFGQELRAIAASVDPATQEIHAAVLGLAKLEAIAGDLLSLLRKSGPTFAIARVEKRWVLATKIFDTLFDSYENKAVPWHIYNMGPLRLTMVFKLAALLDEESVLLFWSALMEMNRDKARKGMANFCRIVRERVSMLPDERSRQVIGDGLEWAAANPENLGFVHSSKVVRKGHLPNMVGFGNLLAAIEEQSAVWKRPVDTIRHDRQNEFGSAIKNWHELFSNALPGAVVMPFSRKFVPRKVFGSALEISSAKDSPGIQMIDVILWLFSRSLRQELPEKCQKLMDYVYSRARQDDFSYAGVAADLESTMEDMDRMPFSAADLAEAMRLKDEIEAKRLEGMAAYEATREEAE